MTIDVLILGLAGVTFAAVIIFALTSKKQVVEKKENPNSEKSSLAADTDSHGNTK
ncbi:hypothetical protein [Parasulfitobacter algicola]|uniref:Uncharacterized protein n=1 Tax=Parasulfitobacter algicola TaxID=2614809 RepID=A0ABX2IUE0_9RHOB|nr:hypothetical protein [Sulfitobacter algicola]NSX53994.1 hypothetical protein [Sulfitobacter algicola]